MSFQQGLSGLNANSKALATVGNNIANSGTVGFKSGNTAFADVFAASFGGNNQVGVGTSVAAVNQQFTQGTITVSNNPLDMAINGQGFFRMNNNGLISWTRNGQFNIDKDGYMVNGNGFRLTGYLADPTNNYLIVPSDPGDIKIDTADLTPLPTGGSVNGTGLQIGLNLDSREDWLDPANFDPDDPTTYNSATSATVYDSLGNPHILRMFFVKTDPTATPNVWEVFTTLDGEAAAAPPVSDGQIEFTASGGIVVPATAPVPPALPNGVFNLAFPLTNGAVDPLGPPDSDPPNPDYVAGFKLDLRTSTQYGNVFGVNSLTQDGYTSGRLSGITVASDGTIQGRYTNGQSRDLGQVVLGNFTNPNGLLSLGGNQWAETSESGQPLIGVAGSSALGLIQSAAFEESNVDLTESLVSMITLQRAYQANAQTIKTMDQILQTLVNLR
jgi:flagellar hook protein FlgE